MRDRRSNREISPRYRDSRHQSHRHVGRHNDAPHRHRPSPRLVRVSRSSPPPRDTHRSPPPMRDLMPRQSDHHRPIPRDYVSPHQPRVHLSPTRDYHHDIHLPSYIHPDYPSDLSHGIKHQSHGLDPHSLAGHKAVFLDDRPSRSYPETLKPDSTMGDMLAVGIHDNDFRRHTHTRDLYGGERERERDDDRDRDRDIDRNRNRERDGGRDRDTGKVLYRGEAPHSVTATTTHLGSPIEGGQSSYGHGRLCYEHGLDATEDISRAAFGRLPDELRKSRDRAGDHYSDLVLDDTYEKIPYPGLDYSRVDGKAYSPKTVREKKVYSGLLRHTTHKVEGPIHHGFEEGCPVRPLHRHEAPLLFEDRREFHREVARMDREIPQNPIFPDRAKGLHRTDYSPSFNEYVDDLDYEPSHERLMTREHQLRHVHDDHVRDHVVYDDRIFEDDDDDLDNDDTGDEDGHISSPRITVKDRLTLSSPLAANVDHRMVRRAGPSRKPIITHGKQYHSQNFTVPAAVRTNGVKKRLRTGLFDLRKENFRTYKVQRRGMDNEPNIRNANYEYNRVSDEEEFNMVSPTTPDPPEGSEEFNKKLERAFFKYAKIINETSQEKKRFLQPGKGSISCCVCRRQSKEFSETHNLVVHAFHTKKLRTAHLGLHKALCLLMGWNWMISPDESKQYQANPPGEAKVLKQDLILWPPVVVIRDSSIDCNSSSKTISVDMIGGILKDLGICEEKAIVSYGKPSNNVILVKFPPMGSGFELAEELHNHFYQANRGKEHLDDLLKTCTSVTSNKKGNEKEIEDVLYGYMAGIEDLEYIDSGTKKIYLAGKDTIRSRKVMKARITEETAALN